MMNQNCSTSPESTTKRYFCPTPPSHGPTGDAQVEGFFYSLYQLLQGIKGAG